MEPEIDEATIKTIHTAMSEGSLTAQGLCESYLSRIANYDRAGPNINAVLAVNEGAVDRARELDAEWERNRGPSGPLHGIPVLLKDNIETTDVNTTCGSLALEGYRPAQDADAVRRLREAGAIILAKTTLPDFATSWFSYSSISGETKNPYKLDHDAGGSSTGTAAGVAANFGVAGLGTDCGGSARLPASFCNVVCLRSTPGIVSRAGSSLLISFQDAVCPIARTVTDAAAIFDAIVGYDKRDSKTTDYLIARPPKSYRELLEPNAANGSRIGLITNALATAEKPAAEDVNKATLAAAEALRRCGAEVVEVEVPDLWDHVEATSLYTTRSKYDINSFLAERPELAGLSIEKIDERGQREPDLDLIDAILEGPDNPEDDPEYFRRFAAREEFTRTMVDLMGRYELDGFIFPTTQLPAPSIQEGRKDWTVLTFPTNTVIASQTWTPAVTVPAGFTREGLPIGLEFVGKPYDEPTVLRLAYAFEQSTSHRHSPTSTP